MLANVLRRAQIAFLAAGERPAAEALWKDLAQLSTRTRDTFVVLVPLAVEGLQATLAGQLDVAVALGARIVDRGEELGTPGAGRLFGQPIASTALLYLGRPQEASALAFPWGLGSGWRALCLAHAGARAEAASELCTALAQTGLAPEDEAPALVLADLLATAVQLRDSVAVAQLAPTLAGVVAVASTEFTLANVARSLGDAATLLGDDGTARAQYERSLSWATKIQHRPEIALTRLAIAELLLAEARSPTIEGRGGERAEALAHLDFAIAELRAMKMQPALERALRLRSGQESARAPRARPAYPGGLSEREVEVLRLIAAGRSNQQIAEALVISHNTVIRHVSNIFGKTGAANRTEAAAYATHHGLL
jgi:DNA-binding CsgD family transcriptional regulator